ncbi:low-density lipoprotein receptor-related protein 8-like [Physella acuta]|uniref:low-density lipoprotein receptor-related protein 8-like n=1 Tax=Physella acuta TaxID=109671 RepID=UPI0027DD0F90|nr:low-density lipoprotein receptor-related protein 8-like [Physella acuta]
MSVKLLAITLLVFVVYINTDAKGIIEWPENCNEDYFMCPNGGCFPNLFRCNSLNDCGDNSDEEDCPPDCGHENAFRCTNGQCIPSFYVCDGRPHCYDTSDEDCARDCKQPRQFKCANGNCISRRRLCDSDDDCEDQSDEDYDMCRFYY